MTVSSRCLFVSGCVRTISADTHTPSAAASVSGSVLHARYRSRHALSSLTSRCQLQEEFDLTYLFVAHDLSVVEHISDRVAVMYLGQIVELTTSDRLYERPLHPYTAALMSAVPVADPDHKMQRIPLEGDVPDPANAPSGCKFHPRCQHAEDRCRTESPELREIEPGHETSCHFAGELTFQKMESAHVG